MNPYEQLIQDLIDGKIEKIDVKREELMAFREAWLKLENRKYVVGKASLNGNVTYNYDPTRLFQYEVFRKEPKEDDAAALSSFDFTKVKVLLI